MTHSASGGGGSHPIGAIETSPLPRSFYRDAPEVVARQLLGKILVSQVDADLLAGRIVEVEAYLGADDPAAHSFSGLTPRNAVLFGEPGRAYVYFIYGMHSCLNVSCEPEGRAGCVLLRALEPLNFPGVEPSPEQEPLPEQEPSDEKQKQKPSHKKEKQKPSEEMNAMSIVTMRRNRGLPPSAAARLIASGPGRLSQALGITRASHNGIDLTSGESPLRIVSDGFSAGEIIAAPRIGIRKAADKPLRFYLAGNPFVSGKRL